MSKFITELFPWLLIIVSLTAFAIVNAKEKSGSEKKLCKFIKGLCVMLSSTSLLYIVLEWNWRICVAIGLIFGAAGILLSGKGSASKDE